VPDKHVSEAPAAGARGGQDWKPQKPQQQLQLQLPLCCALLLASKRGIDMDAPWDDPVRAACSAMRFVAGMAAAWAAVSFPTLLK
jgi:hypothetical protein